MEIVAQCERLELTVVWIGRSQTKLRNSALPGALLFIVIPLVIAILLVQLHVYAGAIEALDVARDGVHDDRFVPDGERLGLVGVARPQQAPEKRGRLAAGVRPRIATPQRVKRRIDTHR